MTSSCIIQRTQISLKRITIESQPLERYHFFRRTDFRKNKFLFVFLTGLMLFLLSCGGESSSSSSSNSNNSPTITSVNVIPASSSLFIKEAQQFSATVLGTGSYSRSVKWFVNDVEGGNATVGTIEMNGLYSAPSTVPNPSTVTVKATSVVDSSKFATASVTINQEYVKISISPTSATLDVETSQEFIATLSGAADTSVNWFVNDVEGGNSTIGTIGRDGYYVAPSTIPDPCTVTIRAISNADNSKSASAEVTIVSDADMITITINPVDPVVSFDTTLQFTATVTGTCNTDVIWSAVLGKITPDGVYTAPYYTSQSDPKYDTIKATSTVNPDVQETTSVKIDTPVPVITEIVPSQASPGEEIHIYGEGFYGDSTAYFSGPNGTIIPAERSIKIFDYIRVTVPVGATTGNLYVDMKLANFSVRRTNSLLFTRVPFLRIRADQKDVAEGESVQFQALSLGDESPKQVTWSTELGSISSDGLYTAPLSLTDLTFTQVKGCIENSTICDSMILGIHPLRINPLNPIVPLGEMLQLSAVTGGETVAAEWILEAGGGDLFVDGTYLAPTSVQESGTVPVKASYGGLTAKTSIGVTGGFPGLVNRVNDYLDLEIPYRPSGTLPQFLDVDDQLAYIVSTDKPFNSIDQHHHWIDLYDVGDPVHPVWLNACESVLGASEIFAHNGYLYQVADFGLVIGAGKVTEVAVYEVLNGHLQLRELKLISNIVDEFYAFNEGVFYAYQDPPDYNLPRLWTNPVQVHKLNWNTNDFLESTLELPLPDPESSATLGYINGTQDRLFLSLVQPAYSDELWKTAVYDISQSPPTLLGTTDISGPMKIFGDLMFVDLEIYNISGSLPVYVGQLPPGVEDVNTDQSKALVKAGQTGLYVVDISNPSAPKNLSVLFDGVVDSGSSSRWIGEYVLTIQAMGGLAVYDGALKGGPIFKSGLEMGGIYGTVYDLLLKPPYLFVAENSDQGPFVNIYDVDSSPPIRIGIYSENEEVPLSLVNLSNILFVGTDQSIVVLDVASPESPVKIASIVLPTSSLAVSGNTLFAGDLEDNLVIFDVSNPASPNTITSVPLLGFPERILARDNLLFIAAESAGMLIYDVSDSSQPILLSQYQPSSAVVDIAVDGNLAFLAAWEGGLIIADISQPSQPVLVGQTFLNSISPFTLEDPVAEVLSVALNNGIAYVGGNLNNGIVQGYDYSQPLHPRLVSLSAFADQIYASILNFAFYKSDMFVGGDLYFLGVYQNDISQPGNVIKLYFPPLEY